MARSGTLERNIFSTGAQKLALFPDRLRVWMEGGVPIPITLEIHPTERCNHHCPDCQARLALPVAQVKRRAKAGADLDLGLLRSVWEAPPEGIVISGNTGDPLLHPEIASLLGTVGRLRIPTVLITNGEALTPELAAQAVRVCRGVRISLDAFDPASFRLTHGARTESWERVLAGLRALVAAKRALVDEGASVGIGYLTGAATRSGMLRATEFARDLGVDYIQFRPFHWEAADVEAELRACAALAVPGCFQVLCSRQKYARRLAETRTYSRCRGAYFYTVLDARADFHICCHHVGEPAARLGSLRETSWLDFARSAARQANLEAYDVSACLPLCRLHPHNEMLATLLARGDIPAPSLSVELARHAPFL